MTMLYLKFLGGRYVCVYYFFALSCMSVMSFESVYWRKQDQTCFFTLESGSGRGEEAVSPLLGRHGDFQEVSVKEA